MILLVSTFKGFGKVKDEDKHPRFKDSIFAVDEKNFKILKTARKVKNFK